jgi:hypothetical protein
VPGVHGRDNNPLSMTRSMRIRPRLASLRAFQCDGVSVCRLRNPGNSSLPWSSFSGRSACRSRLHIGGPVIRLLLLGTSVHLSSLKSYLDTL